MENSSRKRMGRRQGVSKAHWEIPVHNNIRSESLSVKDLDTQCFQFIIVPPPFRRFPIIFVDLINISSPAIKCSIIKSLGMRPKDPS